LVEVAVRTTFSSRCADRLLLHVAARRIAPLAALVAALLWMLGLYFSARPEFFLTKAGYFWLGVAVAAFGLLAVPVILSTARDRTLQLAGFLIAAGMVVTGALLPLDAYGLLGQKPPLWVVNASDAPLVALFAWIAATSYRGRRSQDLGSIVFALGLLSALAVPGWIFALSAEPSTAAAGIVDGLLALVVLASTPAWFIAVSIRLWRARVSASQRSA
jgi:hypothetical protein